MSLGAISDYHGKLKATETAKKNNNGNSLNKKPPFQFNQKVNYFRLHNIGLNTSLTNNDSNMHMAHINNYSHF